MVAFRASLMMSVLLRMLVVSSMRSAMMSFSLVHRPDMNKRRRCAWVLSCSFALSCFGWHVIACRIKIVARMCSSSEMLLLQVALSNDVSIGFICARTCWWMVVLHTRFGWQIAAVHSCVSLCHGQLWTCVRSSSWICSAGSAGAIVLVASFFLHVAW